MEGTGDKTSSVGVHSDHELDRFVYHISHDLRASMRAIVLVPGWIEEDLNEQLGSVPASVQGHVKLLTDQARRLDTMMKDLLIYSRVGRMQTTGVIDLSGALDHVVGELGPPDTLALTRDLGVTELTGWSNDIEVLLYQLLSNVVKHGGGAAHLSTAQTEAGVSLRVVDEGPGIPPKQHVRIFEMMTTLKPRDEVEGSGLGLAISQKIMTLHGGTIEVMSDGLGNGTEFVAVFPDLPAPALSDNV